MKFRVLLPLLIVGVLAVIALVVPIGTAFAVNRTQEVQFTRTSAMDHIVQLAEQAIDTGDVTALDQYLHDFHDVYGEAVTVLDVAGDVVSASGSMRSDPDAVASVSAAAVRNLPQDAVPLITPFSAVATLLADPVQTSGAATAGAVVLEADLSRARMDVTRSWTIVIVIGIALLLVLMIAALRWTDWVLRPVQQLDEAVRALPDRHPTLRERGGPPELQRLTTAVATMADSVEHTLSQQRDFVADASHQLRNPLAAIRLQLDSMRLSPDDVATDLDSVDADVDRLERIVNRMLDLADAENRASASMVAGDGSRRVHTVASAAALVEPFRLIADAAGITLVPVGDTAVTVAGPRSDLEEIVGTLIENAARYAGRGARVTVRLVTTPTHVGIIVSDDGPGLSAEDLERAGTRFWRSVKHQSTPGTGLGLAIVNELARANDADVIIDRADEGGLRVTVRFPRPEVA